MELIVEFRAWRGAAAGDGGRCRGGGRYVVIWVLQFLQVSSQADGVTMQRSEVGQRWFDGTLRTVSAHWRKLTTFSIIGFSIFVFGLCFQALLVREGQVPAVPAYIAQLVLSVEANFLANFRFTWRDRHAPFWRAARRYNLKRGAGVLFSLMLYPLLIRMGMNYLMANALIVALLTPTNYILGHRWTFASGGRQMPADQPREDLELLEHP
jgi:putative flippase GtrA